MGKITVEKGETVFKQDSGEITARFEGYKERQMLLHEGSPIYKKVFYGLVGVGLAYLAIIFLYYLG